MSNPILNNNLFRIWIWYDFKSKRSPNQINVQSNKNSNWLIVEIQKEFESNESSNRIRLYVEYELKSQVNLNKIKVEMEKNFKSNEYEIEWGSVWTRIQKESESESNDNLFNSFFHSFITFRNAIGLCL